MRGRYLQLINVLEQNHEIEALALLRKKHVQLAICLFGSYHLESESRKISFVSSNSTNTFCLLRELSGEDSIAYFSDGTVVRRSCAWGR